MLPVSSPRKSSASDFEAKGRPARKKNGEPKLAVDAVKDPPFRIRTSLAG
jgi:hypothetical protein